MKIRIAILSAILLATFVSQVAAQAKKHDEIAREAIENAAYGSRAYLKRDYKAAISLYSKAIELERQERTLPRDIWRVVVDNLGMSYAFTGDLKNAKIVFEYGIENDKTYPMFYYNLACTYAEMNDLDGALKNLDLTFKFRKNLIKGETLPVPENDDSFKWFLKDEKFIAGMKEIRARNK